MKMISNKLCLHHIQMVFITASEAPETLKLFGSTRFSSTLLRQIYGGFHAKMYVCVVMDAVLQCTISICWRCSVLHSEINPRFYYKIPDPKSHRHGENEVTQCDCISVFFLRKRKR